MFSRLIPQKGAEVILSSNLVSADFEIFMLSFVGGLGWRSNDHGFLSIYQE